MPDFQKMYRKYADDPDVVVLTINNDTNPEEAREYMANNEFTFPVLLDNGYLSTNGVNAFPTTWFVGSDQNLHFEKTGWSGDLVEEFTWRIEVLMADSRGCPLSGSFPAFEETTPVVEQSLESVLASVQKDVRNLLA